METSSQATFIVPSEYSSFVTAASQSPELLHSMSEVVPGRVIGPYVAPSNPNIGNFISASFLIVKVSTTAIGGPAYNPLLSVVQSIQKGDMPSNMQIQEVIQRTQGALLGVKYGGALNERGQKLVDDSQQILLSVQRVLVEKNADEKMQRFLKSTTTLNKQFPKTGGVKTDSFTTLSQVILNFQELVLFIVRSQEFRSILLEFVDIVQVMLGISPLKEEPINERTHALIERGKILLYYIGMQPQYKMAVDQFFSVFDHIMNRGKLVNVSAIDEAMFDSVWRDGESIMLEFAGSEALSAFSTSFSNLFVLLMNDPEAIQYLREVRSYIGDCIRDPVHQSQILFEQGRLLLQERYGTHLTQLFESIKFLFHNIKHDVAVEEFTTRLKQFGADLLFDEHGKLDIFVIQQSLIQVKNILIPVLTAQLSFLPIPRISTHNDKYDFSIENLVLHVGDLLPEHFDLRTRTDATMSMPNASKEEVITRVELEIRNVRAVFTDIHFFYKRKKMPKFAGKGIADVDLSNGNGVNIKIIWKLHKAGEPLALKLLKAKCIIDTLKINVREAKHKILDKLVTKTFNTQIKKQMAIGIVNNIIKTLDPMSAKFNELFAKYSPMADLLNRANVSLKRNTDKIVESLHKKSFQIPPQDQEPHHLQFAREEVPSQTVFTQPFPPSPVGEKEENPVQTNVANFAWYQNGMVVQTESPTNFVSQ